MKKFLTIAIASMAAGPADLARKHRRGGADQCAGLDSGTYIGVHGGYGWRRQLRVSCFPGCQHGVSAVSGGSFTKTVAAPSAITVASTFSPAIS